MRGVTLSSIWLLNTLKFQLTRLMRGVTLLCSHLPAGQTRISTHTPHARRDAVSSAALALTSKFQLTRLMRGVTASASGHYIFIRFQLTRLMRGVTERLTFESAPARISTHTPHARRD